MLLNFLMYLMKVILLFFVVLFFSIFFFLLVFSFKCFIYVLHAYGSSDFSLGHFC